MFGTTLIKAGDVVGVVLFVVGFEDEERRRLLTFESSVTTRFKDKTSDLRIRKE